MRDPSLSLMYPFTMNFQMDNDDWVMVKKQKITILIPPPPITSPITKNNQPNKECNSAQNSSHLPLFNPTGAIKKRNRALNFEKRLKKFGGLRRYLSSLQLSRFVQMIEREKLDVVQLTGLTMEKLKEMGEYAVGPRRKLLHAIDILCQDI